MGDTLEIKQRAEKDLEDESKEGNDGTGGTLLHHSA